MNTSKHDDAMHTSLNSGANDNFLHTSFGARNARSTTQSLHESIHSSFASLSGRSARGAHYYKHSTGFYEELSDDHPKIGIWAALSVNLLNCFGTGPFITAPLVIALADPAGPQALIGYGLAALACTCDSYIWSELGSLFPKSGGTLVYFEEAFGKKKWGRLFSFLFVWQFVISGPMEIASGFLAIASYMDYIWDMTDLQESLLAASFAIVAMALVYFGADQVDSISVILWVGSLIAIIFTLWVGLSHFAPEKLEADADVWDNTPKLLWSLGSAMRFGIYDFMGYYDINYMAEEVVSPRTTIPFANVYSMLFCGLIFVLVDVAIFCVVPWHSLTDIDPGTFNIMSRFAEIEFGRDFAIFFTAVVAWTIFGSCYSLVLGYAYIPYIGAKRGYFFEALGKGDGFPFRSFFLIGVLSMVCCFFDLDVVINSMVACRIVTQFLLQAAAVIALRRNRPELQRLYSMPLYPIPIIFQVILFLFTFVSTDNYLIMGKTPELECCLGFIVFGFLCFLIWSKYERSWPFEPRLRIQTQSQYLKSTSPTSMDATRDDKREPLIVKEVMGNTSISSDMMISA